MSVVPNRPDWLVPGAEVVVFTLGGVGYGNESDGRQTTIDKVATQSFTIVGAPGRFRISNQECRAQVGWHGCTKVVPIDSDQARRELAKVRRQRLESAATRACDAWRKDRSPTNRQAVIDAFQAIADNEEPTPPCTR